MALRPPEGEGKQGGNSVRSFFCFNSLLLLLLLLLLLPRCCYCCCVHLALSKEDK
jgi:hypothetical protein